MEDAMPLGKVRDHLSEVVDDVRRTHRRVTVTTHGRPAAVLIAPDDLEAIEATLEILADEEAMTALLHNRDHPDEGMTLSKEDALDRWARL
ncbi:MAG: hypothetical protein DLM54_09460 [Acidimicrobiales bacterium]|nr:MAG: hypothetical protein DLM54_09460 [Acidimicrobiales bacterium]